MNKDDVLQEAKEQNVKFIQLQFTDILGVTKNVSIPVEQLEKALDGELMFDGSSIEGFVRIEESDMYLRPDPVTFKIFPWVQDEEGCTARMICDIYNPDGSVFEGCPRGVLRRATERASAMGFQMKAGPEPEFFLFLKNGETATTETHDHAGYFDLAPADLGEEARRDMVITLSKMGFKIEAAHHEVAPGQHEIDFMYEDAIQTADNVATFRFVVRIIAKRHGLHATFMPKPIFGINGSGMHVHQSLFCDDNNAFYDPNTPNGLSKVALQYIAGTLKHACSFTAITNPNVNSYKRLVPGYEAPVYIAWSERNRSPLIRIPARRGKGTRLELRNPDPSCNPYLALAVMLRAGLDGIEHSLEPPAHINRNIYAIDAAERRQLGIAELPANLGMAIAELERSELMRSVLGHHVFDRFVEAKKQEWQEYSEKVHPWEVDRYLTLF